MTPADIQTDGPRNTDLMKIVAEEAGCTGECKILAGYSVARIAHAVWHGTPRMKAETMVESIVGDPEGRAVADKLVAWIKALHAAEEALGAD